MSRPGDEHVFRGTGVHLAQRSFDHPATYCGLRRVPLGVRKDKDHWCEEDKNYVDTSIHSESGLDLFGVVE